VRVIEGIDKWWEERGGGRVIVEGGWRGVVEGTGGEGLEIDESEL